MNCFSKIFGFFLIALGINILLSFIVPPWILVFCGAVTLIIIGIRCVK
ncbi:hypothetical protein SDC9_85277 [bioreactor metagenome]|uniref:Uncharacterized protein n=1 Tax=bioreactor metagenome TaxID=1076179 RepID=A0A644ZD77_9ZZZZ